MGDGETSGQRPLRGPVRPSGVVLRAAFEQRGCYLARWKNISVNIWATQATLAFAEELAKLSARVTDGNPKISLISLITNHAPMPTAEARTRFEAITAEYAARMACMGLMLDGKGFWASTMRSFVSGLHVVQRRSYKSRIFANTDDVAHWLAPIHSRETGVLVEPGPLAEALEQARLRAVLSVRE